MSTTNLICISASMGMSQAELSSVLARGGIGTFDPEDINITMVPPDNDFETRKNHLWNVLMMGVEQMEGFESIILDQSLEKYQNSLKQEISITM